MVPALQPFVAVASVLLRFVLLLPPNQALERQRSDRRSWRRPQPPPISFIVSTASAVDHRLPDSNAPQAKPVPGLTGTPEVPLVGDLSTRVLTVACVTGIR
jgi:hypothetical protein